MAADDPDLQADLEDLESKMGDPSVDEGPDDPEPVAPEEGGEPAPDAPPDSLLVRLCHAAEDHYGLHIGECDAPGAPSRWGPVHHVHAKHSLHYAHRAADISGLEQNMRRFAAWVSAHNTPQLAELIHNPGSSIKNGHTVPTSFWGTTTWNGHRDHVHLAI
jgi:hypothetical protein